MSIVVTVDDPRWTGLGTDIDRLCRRAAAAALESAGHAGGEVTVMLADDPALRDLNARFRDRDAPTNVLAFPAGDAVTGAGTASPPLGDIALAFETVTAEAQAQGKTAADHTAHLVVHGVLHLLGFDHMSIETAGRMEQREIDILGGLGIADPYRAPSETGPVP